MLNLKSLETIGFLFLSLFVSNRTFGQIVPDNSFGNNGIVITPTSNSSEAMVLAVQNDGKILAAGYTFTNSDIHFQIARYNSDGILDNGFGNLGIVTTSVGFQDVPYTMVLQSDGKILVAGNSDFRSIIIRYNSNGILDNNFGVGGIITTSTWPSQGISTMALQDDGKFIVGESAGNQFFIMKRYKNDGTLDNSFGTGGISSITFETQSTILSIVIQPNGKILAAGGTSSNTNSKFALARFNSDGTLDSGFGVAGKIITEIDPSPQEFENDVCNQLALLTDGKIIAGGRSGSKGVIAKYNSDGSLDMGFAAGGIISSYNFRPVLRNGMVLQYDGKIVINGVITIFPYNAGYNLTRLNTDGSLDNTFGIGGNIALDISTGNDFSQCLAIQNDQKIITAGSSRTSSLSPAYFTIVRFTTDWNGIKEYTDNEGKIKIYPNPTIETIHFEATKDLNIKTIELVDVGGKLIKSFLPTETFLDLMEIANGNYLLHIKTDKGTYSEKIIKE